MNKVNIVIVSHNNRDILPLNLNALKKQTLKNFKVYLMDNDSTDGTEKFIKENYPKVNFMQGTKNVSNKRNKAIFSLDSEYVVTLDSDTILPPNWIKTAVEYMDGHPRVGLMGGKLINKAGLVDFAGGITAKNGVSGDRGHNLKDSSKYNKFMRVSFIKSACLIARKNMLKQVGGFSEIYEWGYEDVDLGMKANLAGWYVVYNPDLIAQHLSHATMSKHKTFELEDYLTRRGRLIFLFSTFQNKTLLFNWPNIFASILAEFARRNPSSSAKAYWWLIKNFNQILNHRKKIENIRKISDKKLFDEVYFPSLCRNYEKNNGFLSKIERINNFSLKEIVFFITTKCNSRCKHCFYWKTLNSQPDLSLKDAEKILSYFYNLESVDISGGEPFIRPDLSELISKIIKYTNTKCIRIPTNGILHSKQKFIELLKNNPEVDFLMSFSLDGLKEEHDYIRGINGNFEMVVQRIKEFKELRKNYPNFKDLQVNTVITNHNYKNLPQLIDYVKKLEVDNHSFDIIRGSHSGIFGTPDIELISPINKLRYKTAKYYTRKKPFIKRIFNNLRIKKILDTQLQVLKGKKWNFDCTAGKTDVVIESDGSLRICELTEKIGNLKKEPLETLLSNKKAKDVFNLIKNHACDCTHICNLSKSANKSFAFSRPK